MGYEGNNHITSQNIKNPILRIREIYIKMIHNNIKILVPF